MASQNPEPDLDVQPAKRRRLSDNPLFLATIPAAVSIFAALLSAMSASSAREDADKFAEQRLTREERMKVYERVEAQLGSDETHGILIAAAYTGLIQDAEMKQNLCELINLVAREKIEAAGSTDMRAGHIATLARIARDTRECSDELRRAMASYQATQSSGERAPPPPASQLQQAARQETPVQTVLTPNPNPQGWDIDVFSCEGQGQLSRQLAGAVAQRLAQYAQTNQPLGGQALGRIRLRHASVAAQRQLTPDPLGHSVLGSPDEQQLLNAVVADLNLNMGGARFGIRQAPPTTPYYVSVFACGFTA
jgi:hypothetical protein